MALQYGTSTTLLTISGSSVGANVAYSTSNVTSSTSNNSTDYLVTISVPTSTTTANGNKQIVVYAYRSEDGTNYQGGSANVDNVDGSAKALTALGSPTNLTFLGTVQLNNGANAVTLRQVFSLTQAFGSIPPKWGVVLYNDNGAAAVSTSSNVVVTYREVYYS